MMYHHNFRFDHKLEIGKSAVRRIPFSCEACSLKLYKHWDMKNHNGPQVRYESNDKNCIYWPIFEGLNNW